MDKQSWILIALELDLPSILKLCETNKNIKGFVCDNYYFWTNKLKKDYNFTFTGIPNKNRDPRKLYQYLNNFEMHEDTQAAEFIEEGNDDLAKFLILTKKKSDVPHNARSLKTAAAKNNTDMIEFLKEHQMKGQEYDFLRTVMQGAILGGQFELLTEYLQKLKIWGREPDFHIFIRDSLYAKEYAILMLDYLFGLWGAINLASFVKRKENQTSIMSTVGYLGRLDLLLYLKSKGFDDILSVLKGASISDNIQTIQLADYILNNEEISSEDIYDAFSSAISVGSKENSTIANELIKIYMKHGLNYQKASKMID